MSATTPSPASRREIFAWTMYDWANSAYSTITITVLVVYISDLVVSPESKVATDLTRSALAMGLETEPGRWGNLAWAWLIAISMFSAALASPVLGAIADLRASKRQCLAITVALGSLLAISLALIPPERSWIVVLVTFGMMICYELSIGFYNAFLPEISTEDTIDRVSAWGFAMGYVGGGLALLGAMGIVMYGESFGLNDNASKLRTCLLLMGLWWGGFSLPTLIYLHDRGPAPRETVRLATAARLAFREVWNTLANVRKYRALAVFLLGFLFFNEGVQTVISQASVFAKEDFGFTQPRLIILILMVQFVSLGGALLVGYLTSIVGQKKTLIGCLLVWINLLVTAYFIESEATFWMLAVILGMVMGGTQSVSRAMVGVMTPRGRSAEFFGFFNLSGKATSWFGAFLFGWVVLLTGSPRKAIVSLIVLFLIGLFITATVDLAAGKRQANAES
jgi:UMF1 family MFS transporter